MRKEAQDSQVQVMQVRGALGDAGLLATVSEHLNATSIRREICPSTEESCNVVN